MLKAERNTKQKKTVRKYLKSNYSHPSADQIFEEVKKDLPDISKATVYRILRNLQEKGEIQEIPTDRAIRWDYNEEPHPHFICSLCEAVFDVEKEDIEIPKKDKLSVGEVDKCRVVFCGKCKDC